MCSKLQCKILAGVGNTFVNDGSECIVLGAVVLYAGHLIQNDLLLPSALTSFLLYQMQLGTTFYVSSTVCCVGL